MTSISHLLIGRVFFLTIISWQAKLELINSRLSNVSLFIMYFNINGLISQLVLRSLLLWLLSMWLLFIGIFYKTRLHSNTRAKISCSILNIFLNSNCIYIYRRHWTALLVSLNVRLYIISFIKSVLQSLMFQDEIWRPKEKTRCPSTVRSFFSSRSRPSLLWPYRSVHFLLNMFLLNMYPNIQTNTNRNYDLNPSILLLYIFNKINKYLQIQSAAIKKNVFT